MRFLVDAMLPPQLLAALADRGHDAWTPADLGAHNLPDEVLVEIATTGSLVIVTENASDFAQLTSCPVLFVRKVWWPASSLVVRLGKALDGWAARNPEPGTWPHWLPSDLR